MFRFRDRSPEIRFIIYYLVDVPQSSFYGTEPPLLLALASNLDLYPEAVAVYYPIDEAFLSLPSNKLRQLKHLRMNWMQDPYRRFTLARGPHETTDLKAGN
jgi:hypothetical protein